MDSLYGPYASFTPSMLNCYQCQCDMFLSCGQVMKVIYTAGPLQVNKNNDVSRTHDDGNREPN